MEDISYFFNILEKSDISLLGYTFKNERIKDEIISKIPHVEIKEIDSSFSFRSYLRNEKLNHLFELWKLSSYIIYPARLIQLGLNIKHLVN